MANLKNQIEVLNGKISSAKSLKSKLYFIDKKIAVEKQMIALLKSHK